MPGRQHTFAYDNAGNRTAASNDDSLPQSETVNALGQITRKENKSIHVSGVADEGVTVAARTDEGVSTVRAAASAGRFWSIELSVNAATDTGAGRANTNVYLGKPAPSPEEDNIIKTVPLALFMSPKKEGKTNDPRWCFVNFFSISCLAWEILKLTKHHLGSSAILRAHQRQRPDFSR